MCDLQIQVYTALDSFDATHPSVLGVMKSGSELADTIQPSQLKLSLKRQDAMDDNHIISLADMLEMPASVSCLMLTSYCFAIRCAPIIMKELI
jgi:hypothetical protein